MKRAWCYLCSTASVVGLQGTRLKLFFCTEISVYVSQKAFYYDTASPGLGLRNLFHWILSESGVLMAPLSSRGQVQHVSHALILERRRKEKSHENALTQL